MKVTFRGWEREVHAHNHVLKPVKHTSQGFVESKKGSLSWHDGLSAYGKIERVSLTGSFLAEFEFDQAELRSWLLKFAESNPAEALRLMSEAQAEAIIALNSQVAEEA
jgi:hypothetical protein